MADPSQARERIAGVARDVFGFTLTAAQARAAQAAATGHDVLAVLPTGSGKSAIYQVAGLVRGGLTVVVSPLVSLQRDQARSLGERRRADGSPISVITLNATLTGRGRAAALSALPDADFVMLGPEQLANAETHERLVTGGSPVNLFVVDEAHLVSEWGHDFRPDYLRVRDTVNALGRPPVMALTATASPPVQADVTRQLAMRDAAVVIGDFDRPNIRLSVRTARPYQPEETAVADRVLEAIIEHETPAIVYAMSHARCEDIAERLRLAAYRAAPYHAGLSAADRLRTQDGFFGGHIDIVVATSAFGMGIDKPDVRTVVHAGPPASVDEYYQEIGRAGRDGKPSRAEMVFDSRSLRVPRLFASRPQFSEPSVRAVVAAIGRLTGPMPIEDVIASSSVPKRAAERVVGELAELGLVSLDDGVVTPQPCGLPAAAEDAVEQAGRRRVSVLRSEVDTVRHYAETTACRRAELLAYFGQEFPAPCGNCDNDEVTRGARPVPPPPAEPRPDVTLPRPGTPVTHKLWGDGTVLSADAHEMVVAFDSVGYRHLTTATLSNGLVKPH